MLEDLVFQVLVYQVNRGMNIAQLRGILDTEVHMAEQKKPFVKPVLRKEAALLDVTLGLILTSGLPI